MARIIREGKLQPQPNSGGITRITVGGFKSIVQEQSIEIKPLTILAGANSSGKSSIMQPLLLLKQTLESTYDPGALLLNGPNVKFTLVNQLLSRTQEGKLVDTFHTGIDIDNQDSVRISFNQNKDNKGFDVKETEYGFDNNQFHVYVGMSIKEMRTNLLRYLRIIHDSQGYSKTLRELMSRTDEITASVISEVVRDRFFLTPGSLIISSSNDPIPTMTSIRNHVRKMIHLPGLRGNPERNYPATAVGFTFPGAFETYVASIIEQWQTDGDKQKLAKLYNNLALLALTKKVVARRRNDVEIELLVNRFLQGDKEDMVSIADVGMGVSQALPVVVALHTANSGQLVYIEQPEIHLHPRAQYAMAEVLADAAKEGKRMVIETHSSILLLGIQTLVAEGKLPPELVKLHWFTQQEDGSTKIDSADLDETGAYGDWPEDFASVTLHSESRYLDAAEARLMGE